MKININSWHYKYYRWCERYALDNEMGDFCPNLCSYVQTIFFGSIISAMICCLLAALIGMMLFSIGKIEYILWTQYINIALMIHFAIIAVIGLIFAYGRFSKSDTTYVIRSYVSANKNKVCPLIEFVDNE
jgi:hypothetical protein